MNSTLLNMTSALNPLAAPGLPLSVNESSLATALKIIAELQRQIETLQEEAATDGLTGLLNKKAFTKALEREMARASRAGKSTAMLVMFDLDGLKAINDSCGHLAGDAYISLMAEILHDNIRSTDYVARLGGDEFALLLTDVDLSKGWLRINRLVELLNSRTLRLNNGKSFSLRVSHGASIVTPNGVVAEIIGAADEQLYARKAQRKKEFAH